jgi:polyhydroxyalkanoate synthesis regulator phasin
VKSCLALAGFANRRDLPEFAGFFLNWIEERKSDRQKEAIAADDLRYLETVESAAGEGDESARHLLELSRLGATEFATKFADEILRRVAGARQLLGNGAFRAAFFEMADETNCIRRLRGAGKLRAIRRATALRRQAERLRARERALLKSGEIQRQELRRIIDQLVVSAKERKRGDIVAVAKRIADAIHHGPQATSRKRQTVSAIVSNFKVGWISDLFTEAAAAEEKGEPLDSVQFTERLEDLLEIGREPKKPNEKK